ncbi:MAG: hypothetical protein JXR07_07725 [Reichenbachiella sp.]
MDKKYIELAIKNISKYGDTDIFPFPIENHMLYDEADKVVPFIQKLHKDHKTYLDANPPQIIRTCSPVGYTGLRWATQIEPYWNIYFLSLVLSLSEEIELQRMPIEDETVHSYRIKLDHKEGTLYSLDSNWHSFQLSSLNLVKEDNSQYEFVVICDIADFYSRIYHHTLENLLKDLENTHGDHSQILRLLTVISGGTSYGLPIGGAASRILAELFLTSIDNLMTLKGITFKRFVDDIHLFASSEEEAHSHLNELSISLMSTEGLTLQKYKTQILSKKEFIHIVKTKISADSDDKNSKVRAQFMALPINYDPYSESADDDYEKIKSELDKFDILDLLNSELRKSRIHQAFSKHLLRSFKALEPQTVSYAFDAISNKLEHLAPIFPNIMMAAASNFDKLTESSRENLLDKLRSLVISDSYLLQLELNAVYLIRVLGKEKSVLNQRVLNQVYSKFSESFFVKSWVILIYGRWRNQAWWTDKKNSYPSMSNWEKRSFFLASYFIGEKGGHWRKTSQKGLLEFHSILKDWAIDKKKDSNWKLPI